MTVLGEPDYATKVYAEPDDDRRAHPLQRALHAELCSTQHARKGRMPACVRAFLVCKRWTEDGYKTP